LAAVLAVALGAPAVGGAASSTTRTYSLSGTTTTTPGGGCLDCLAFSSVTTGSATCTACLPGDPAAGTFTLNLPTITTYQPNPCRIKTMSGTLIINWNNGTTSTAIVSGHFDQSQPILHLSGQFDVESLVQWSYEHPGIAIPNFPTSPCVETTNPVSAALVISK